MSLTLWGEVERSLDPSDLNKCIDIARKSLRLMCEAQYAIVTDDSGLRMGRDQKSDLSVAIYDLAKELGLLDSWANAEAVEKLCKRLHAEK